MSRRDGFDEYRDDVLWEEYRRGLPEGSISEDRIWDGYDRDRPPSYLCDEVARRQQEQRESAELAQYEYEQQLQYEEGQQMQYEEDMRRQEDDR